VFNKKLLNRVFKHIEKTYPNDGVCVFYYGKKVYIV